MSSGTSKARDGRLILYAPNVHTGGGMVLLRAVMEAWPAEQAMVAWLDARAQSALRPPPGSEVTWVEASLGSRVLGEISLAARGEKSDRVLCFHGLPPLLPNAAEVLVFQQNRNYFGQVDLASFAFRTRLRLRLEQFFSWAFRRRVDTYWVQTPSMARSLKCWFGTGEVGIHVLPFAAPFNAVSARPETRFDFVYVADGEAHKNHRTLVEAWVRLKLRGVAPSLALTLSQRDTTLREWVASEVRIHGLNIEDLGVVPYAEVSKLYSRSRALIFPSLSESFGLPLIEAGALGLPILAGEVDFVRDVCQPAETFDPTSAVSIERAVLRFLDQSEVPEKTVSAAVFLNKVMETAGP